MKELLKNCEPSLVATALKIVAEDDNLPPVDSLELAQYYVNKYKNRLSEIDQKLAEEKLS